MAIDATAARTIETRLAWLTLGGAAVYFVFETWVSAQGGPLWHPLYFVDLVAMALLVWGAVHSLRARPKRSPGILCAGLAWTAANGWRATAARYYTPEFYGSDSLTVASLWPTLALTIFAIAVLALSLYLAALHD